MGIKDLNRKYNLNEIVKGDSIFCATGITSGDLVNGIELDNTHYTSETFVTHKDSNLKEIIKTKKLFHQIFCIFLHKKAQLEISTSFDIKMEAENTATLADRIKVQGDIVRRLKEQKADKSKVRNLLSSFP